MSVVSRSPRHVAPPSIPRTVFNMNATHIRKPIACVSMLLGVGWLLISIPPIFRIASQGGLYLFNLTFLPLMAIPGVIAIYYGLRLYREMSESSLKMIIGNVAFIAAVSGSHHLSARFHSSLSVEIQSSLSLFLGSLIATGAYLLITRMLLGILGGVQRSLRDLLRPGVLILLAWLLWNVLSHVLHECLPGDWYACKLFVPLVLAYGSYMIAMHYLAPNNKYQETLNSYPKYSEVAGTPWEHDPGHTSGKNYGDMDSKR